MSAPIRYPYPGLRSFTRDESDLFFGRDGCVDRMVDRLAATRFLAILGPSGGGKSSLVRTGLLDALDLGLHSAAGSHWRIAEMHPGGSPLKNLAEALLRARDGVAPHEQDVILLAQFLRRGPRAVSEWAAGGNLTDDWNLLILVDQFEELFRYDDYAEAEEAEAFTALLLETASVPNARLHVVLTMRSEYLGACSLLPGLAERVNDGIYLTPRMSREECKEAIEGPARVMGFQVEPALVNRLLNDLASFAPWETDPGARQGDQLARRADQLPLMQHVLNRLWIRAMAEAKGGAAQLKLDDYEECGGLTGAIDNHAAEVMDELGKGARRGVEAVFRALVSGTSVATAVRRPCRMRELIDLVGSKRDAVAIVEAFSAAGCNFLRLSDARLDEETIADISHESLIRQWTLLRGWLEEEARDGAEWARLTAARERHEEGKEEFLSGLNLTSLDAWFAEAKPSNAWAKRHGGRFEDAVAFLEESRKVQGLRTDAERRRERRERNLLRALVAVLGGIMLGGCVVAYMLYQSYRESDQKVLGVLTLVSEAVQADDYVSLLGFASFQSTLAHIIQERAGDIDAKGTGIVKPTDKVHMLFRLAMSVDEEGDPVHAMEHYRKGYRLGKEAINTATPRAPVSDHFKILVIKNAGRLAWRLFDTGNTAEARQLINEMKRWTQQRHRHSEEWLAAEALVHSLESRFHRDNGRPTEALAELQKARTKIQPVTERALKTKEHAFVQDQRLTMDQMRLAYWVHLGLLRAEQNPAERQKLADTVRKLAKAMTVRNPMDRRAIAAHVTSLVSEVTRSQDPLQATLDAYEAKELVDAGLKLAQNDRSLHLLRAQIEVALASSPNAEGPRVHLGRAKAAFVKALEGNFILTSPIPATEVFNKISAAEFSGASMNPDVKFYRSVNEAATRVLRDYRNAPAFKDIARDASRHIAQLESRRQTAMVR